MDLTELQVERVRTLLTGARERVNLIAKIHVAVLAVALTAAASAAVANMAGQLAPAPSASILVAATAVMLFQIRALVKLLKFWDKNVDEHVGSIDKLMRNQGEPDADAP